MKKLIYVTLATTGIFGISIGVIELNQNYKKLQNKYEYHKKWNILSQYRKGNTSSRRLTFSGDHPSFFGLEKAINQAAINIMYKTTSIGENGRPYIYYFTEPESEWENWKSNKILPENISQHVGYIYGNKIYKQAHSTEWNEQPQNENNQILKEAYQRLQLMLSTGVPDDIARKSFEILLANKSGTVDILSSPYANIATLSTEEIGKLIEAESSYSAFEQAKKDHPEYSLEKAIASNGKSCSVENNIDTKCWEYVYLNNELNKIYDLEDVYNVPKVEGQFSIIQDTKAIHKIYSFEKLYDENNKKIDKKTSDNNFIWSSLSELIKYITNNQEKFIGFEWEAYKNDFNH